jgi:hypothetical protein
MDSLKPNYMVRGRDTDFTERAQLGKVAKCFKP